MHPLGPQASDDLAAAKWIGPRLIPGFGALVGRMVPTGYERYARILHPASDHGRAVRWAEVARFTGRTLHPLVQWHRLVGAEDSFGEGGVWPGNEPFRGELELADLAALIGVLSRHTATDDCWFCWDVFGHADATALRPDSPMPRIKVAGQRYLLARGALSTALFIGRYSTDGETFFQEAPSLWWPQDHSWFVGSDMDIDSTVIGGSTSLIEDVLADPRLEAFPVGPDDSLMADADVVNQ